MWTCLRLSKSLFRYQNTNLFRTRIIPTGPNADRRTVHPHSDVTFAHRTFDAGSYILASISLRKLAEVLKYVYNRLHV